MGTGLSDINYSEWDCEGEIGIRERERACLTVYSCQPRLTMRASRIYILVLWSPQFSFVDCANAYLRRARCLH